MFTLATTFTLSAPGETPPVADAELARRHYVAGRVCQQRGDFAGAEAALRSAARLCLRRASPARAGAPPHRRRGRGGGAAAPRSRAPGAGQRGSALHGLGLVLRLAGDAAGAEQAFRAALACDPGAVEPGISLSYLLGDQGRLDEMEAAAISTAAAMRRRLAGRD